MNTYIDVAKVFSKYPGGRFRKDGPASGESFREDVLKPAFESGGKVVLDFNGTLGVPTSFLSEAFRGLPEGLVVEFAGENPFNCAPYTPPVGITIVCL